MFVFTMKGGFIMIKTTFQKKKFWEWNKKKNVDQPLTQAFRCDKGKVPTFN